MGSVCPQVPSIGVGMVGYAFMGRAHSQAWQAVSRVFDLPLRPRLAAICGRDKAATGAAADRLGWAAAETDWRALIARDDVQLVDIVAPGSLHAPIAIAALQAGKHVLCEKPLANTLAEAERDGGRGRRRVPERRARRWSGSTTAGCRPSRWPGGWSSRAGSARCGTSAPCTCRTGWSTRTRR